MRKLQGMLLCALLLLAGACGGSTAPAASGAARIATTPPTTIPPDVDLLARIIPSVPTGLPQMPEKVGVTGLAGLDTVSLYDGQPGARQSLIDNKFVLGYQRLWQKDDSQIVVFIYRFVAAAGAAAYQRRLIANTQIATPGLHPQQFSVPAISSAQGVSLSSDTGAVVYGILLTRDTYVAQIEAIGPGASQGLVVDLAKRQYQRL